MGGRMIWWMVAGCVASGADEVGAVMLVDGAGFVRRGGEDLPASVGLVLRPDDVLVTRPDAAIVVHLANDHVVRIDAELELPIGDLVMLRAPRATTPPGDQLADLLYPEERDRLGSLVDEAERVAGWHARLTAAHAPGGVTSDEGGAPKNESSRSPSPPGNPAEAGPQTSAARNFAAADEERDDDVVSDDVRVGSGGKSAEPPTPALNIRETARPRATKPPKRPGRAGPPDEAAPPPPPPPPTPAPRVPITLRDLEVRFGVDGDLHTCVATWAAGLPARVDALELDLRVSGGVITRAVAPGGLRLPSCARGAIEGVPFDDAGGTRLRIAL